MIVRRDDNERDLFDSGDVHSFVERPRLHAALADARQADNFFSPRNRFASTRHRHRNHRAEVTDHRELIIARPAPMNFRRVHAWGPWPRAKISARDVEKVFSPNADRPAWSRINGAKMSPFCKTNRKLR